MKKQLIALLVALVPALALAAPSGRLDPMKPDIYNFESLHNGARLFVNYCMGCHSAEHQRFARTAEDLGIPQEVIEENLILSPQLAYNDQMRIGMTASDAAAWFGTPPPDLSLMTRLKGADYVYSLLRGYHLDPSRPFGVNNTVFADIGMPHPLLDLQGEYELVCDPNAVEARTVDPLKGTVANPRDCFREVRAGSLSPAEYDRAVYDLTNFLVYVAEPSKYQSDRLGPKVLIFIFVFFIFAYLLKKEYWRDIKH
ncbi:cytochrome c1 [Marinospirillum alkaliphilum]|uniref:Ubiquinol-cytochrome c reductase cytochrome c1 subunit n=1 Tax=Marinospirillum alkaliphilum DSM 21637 TaxID=1122209 RepID=A0A1K1TR26_9GAMM|nr:cytochrome c1 [Marinospirillum alkaliphilum]SFX02709.1 ubiquinol-cytochrome c reductase cytochrome c1 subunit [Marinospirillum alkaliphilum DSM 21637]